MPDSTPTPAPLNCPRCFGEHRGVDCPTLKPAAPPKGELPLWELEGWETTNPQLVRKSDGYRISLRFYEYGDEHNRFAPFGYSKGYWTAQESDTSRPHKQIVDELLEAINGAELTRSRAALLELERQRDEQKELASTLKFMYESECRIHTRTHEVWLAAEARAEAAEQSLAQQRERPDPATCDHEFEEVCLRCGKNCAEWAWESHQKDKG